MPNHENPRCGTRALLYAFAVGLFFFVALIKFGNPIILDFLTTAPKDVIETIFLPFPVRWGYVLLVPLTFIGIIVGVATYRERSPRRVSAKGGALSPENADVSKCGQDKGRSARFLLWLPLVWLGWQFVASTQTVDSTLTSVTLKHFVACTACFYLGWFGLRGCNDPWPIWAALTLALIWIVHAGLEQHFGGLAESRKFFYQLPNWQNSPPELLKKIQSERIFSTLFYPNSLAGALLLLMPISLAFCWKRLAESPASLRHLVVWILASGGLACLYWSGSKAGWLIALFMGMVVIMHSQLRCRKWIVLALVVVGLAGFGLKYAKFFERGSTSVVARFDYWKAAAQTAIKHPFLGTGPGTFAIPYKALKAPNAEMARLTHNDYLEQASDSGIPGFLAYFAFMTGSFYILYRYRVANSGGSHLHRSAAVAAVQQQHMKTKRTDEPPVGVEHPNRSGWFLGHSHSPLYFFVWLGVVGVGIHSFVEFHLYIPAIAWPSFFLLGWLWGRE